MNSLKQTIVSLKGNENLILFSSIFLIAQISSLLLSLLICYVIGEFLWTFIHMALINSVILGLALIGSCELTGKLLGNMHRLFIQFIAVMLIIGTAIVSFIFLLYFEAPLFIYYERGAFSFLLINLLFMLTLYAISSNLIIHREIILQQEKTIAEERYFKKQTEMKLLSAKVNPHFLFNTLNMLLNLLTSPDKAEQAILNLSDLLRHNLEQADKSSVLLSEELANVRAYLEIQALRFGAKLQFEIHHSIDFVIPPLILQPLVENSIKHNINEHESLTVSIKADQKDNLACIKVHDSAQALTSNMLDAGLGLTFTKKRVENAGGSFHIKAGGVELWFPQ